MHEKETYNYAPFGIDDEQYINQDSDSDLDNNSSNISSISSISSMSSAQSTDSNSQDSSTQSSDTANSSDLDSLDEQEEFYRHCLKLVQEHIHYLENTQVLNPSTVHKVSQLYLILVLYNNDDPKCFHCNLCVCPSTFDSFLEKIQDHTEFTGGGGNAEQLSVDQQLAIALYQFGHFGNSAMVESIAQ